MAHCEHCRDDVPDGATCIRCGHELPEPDELLGREVLGRYRVVRMLAEGGMGRVYLAEQLVGTVVRRVAIKVLRRQLGSDKQLVSRFSREAETLVRLTHPNTVQLFDFGALPDGTLGLVMEYVEGHSLACELLNGPLSPVRAERLLAQACGALQEAHAHGIVHRDLKPDNLLVAERVAHGDFIKVLDFGIAKVSSENEVASTKLTQQGMIIGTPPYMSPEQFSGEAIDARSDIYSLGVIAYEMLTARLPFDARTPWEWASKHLTGEPQALPLDTAAGLLPRHRRAIREALSKRADDRPQTVGAFLTRFTVDDAADGPPAATSCPADERMSVGTSAIAQPAGALPTPKRSLQRASEDEDERDLGSASRALTSSVATPLRGSRTRLWLAAAAAAVLLLLGVFAWGARSRAPRLPPALAMPSLSSRRDTASPALAASPLPSGASLPAEGGALKQPQTRHALARTSATSSHAHERNAVRSTGGAAPSSAPVARSRAQDAPAIEPARSTAKDEHEAASSTPASAPKRPTSVPDDLAQRIALIRATVGTRVEMAVGQFQAAAGKFGTHQALQPVRTQLEISGGSRIKDLIIGGHCAQGQALFRALRSISAEAKAKSAFGAKCPAPP